MIEGESVDRHHWVPKREGGKDWGWLHRICHKKLHSLFDERTLARLYSNPDALKDHPDIVSFVKWIRKKPNDFIGRHDRPRTRRK